MENYFIILKIKKNKKNGKQIADPGQTLGDNLTVISKTRYLTASLSAVIKWGR